MEKQSTNIAENGRTSNEVSAHGGRGGGGGDVDFDSEREWTFGRAKHPKRRRRSTGGASTSHSAALTTSEFKNLPTDDKLVTLFEMLNSTNKLSARVNNIETKVNSLSEASKSTNTRIRTLEYRSIDAEARSRRNNLIFRGIREVYLVENCEALIRQFLKDALDIDTGSIYIQRAHRLGKPTQDSYRPIIVCFRDYPVVEQILKNAYKLKDRPSFGINRDYPREIVDARSRLWQDYKDARALNQPKTVYLGFPAKLIVNRRVVRDEFPDWRTVLDGPRDGRPNKNTKNVSNAAKPAQMANGNTQEQQPPITVRNRFETLAESEMESDSTSDSDDTTGIDEYSQSMLNLEANARGQGPAANSRGQGPGANPSGQGTGANSPDQTRFVSSQQVTLNSSENGAVDLSVNTG